MIKQKVLGLITARGGSKGLPGKNLKELGGIPLIGWTINAAKLAPSISRLILSSDDQQIIETARQFGCEAPFIRPASLATDAATSMDVILHALEQSPGYEYVVLLQPTSPLRTSTDIESCISACIQSQAPAVVSVSEAKTHPWMCYRYNDHAFLESYIKGVTPVRRQEMPIAYEVNGAVYVARVEWLKSQRSFISDLTKTYLMPIERSVDIDSSIDFLVAESLIRLRK